jgi:hypothetical protein
MSMAAPPPPRTRLGDLCESLKSVRTDIHLLQKPNVTKRNERNLYHALEAALEAEIKRVEWWIGDLFNGTDLKNPPPPGKVPDYIT